MATRRAVSPAEFLTMVSLTSLVVLALSIGALGNRGTARASEIIDGVSKIRQLAPITNVNRGD